MQVKKTKQKTSKKQTKKKPRRDTLAANENKSRCITAIILNVHLRVCLSQVKMYFFYYIVCVDISVIKP